MQRKLKILMLEDTEADAGLVERMLKRDNIQFASLRVDTRDDFVEALESFKPDVILSDHSLPQFNSIEAFRIYKERGLMIPFILVTGTVSEEFAVNILKQGADDYILKSNLAQLPAAILQAIEKRRAEMDKLKAEQELLRQNRELSKINQKLDDFVSTVSQTIRAPLGSVKSLINLAEMEAEVQAPVKKYVKMIEGSVAKLDETLNEILLYSVNRRNEVRYERIELEKLIRDCFDQLTHLEGYWIIKKEISMHGGSVLLSDPGQLSVLLKNIISNSILYHDPNKESFVCINCSIDSDRTTVTVDDNGIGIEPEYLPMVFDMFYRATEKSKGVGLGLYIAREVTNRLNGIIEITSRSNQGTTVTVVIPHQRPLN